MGFNILVTTSRGLENRAASELFILLTSMNDSPLIENTGVSGLLKVSTTLPTDSLISDIAKIVAEEPWSVRYIRRIIPIEKVVTSLEELTEAVKTLSKKMNKDETFRVTVEKRHTSLLSNDVIEAAASVIDQKVDLENPDWIIQIEIIGHQIGVSIIRANQILSTLRIKRDE